MKKKYSAVIKATFSVNFTDNESDDLYDQATQAFYDIYNQGPDFFDVTELEEVRR